MDLRSAWEEVRWAGSLVGGGRQGGGSLTTLGEGEGAVREALLAVKDPGVLSAGIWRLCLVFASASMREVSSQLCGRGGVDLI